MIAADVFEAYPRAIRERFKLFHRANPHVYRDFRVKAFQMLRTGRKRYSARRIMESLRWDYDLKTTGDVFEINNDFTPIYVRLLIYNHPEFEDFFELRVIRSRGAMSEEERRRRDEERANP